MKHTEKKFFGLNFARRFKFLIVMLIALASLFGGASFLASGKSNISRTASAVGETYQITYNTDGGDSIADDSYISSASQQTITLATPTKSGYVFGGYTITTQTFGSNSSISSKTTLTIPANAYGDIVVKATWIGYVDFSSSQSFSIRSSYKRWNGTIYYSTDLSTWSTFGTTAINAVETDGTYHIYMYGTNNTRVSATSSSAHTSWAITGTASSVSLTGDIEDLRDTFRATSNKKMIANCYDYMFSGCTKLTSAPTLSAETLTDYCYRRMFAGCTGLTTAPALQATSLAAGCYQSMFSGCTGLTTAPALQATSLADSCYQSMFSGCTGLTTAPTLPATTMTTSCYQSMFSGCTGL
ncbi:MAG TPA: hypothetical protein DCO89_03465, partial [Clostridiales bacterium]|nr:hypothetical protein [Clostridiales bacterium]